MKSVVFESGIPKSDIGFDNLMPPCMKGFPSGYCVFAISLAS